tara:strand:- start:291 stop:566 length:276 start_codon:yes stop_codon:yes gene_type:complete
MIASKDIVKKINERLETTWTSSEWLTGKKVPVEEEWRGRMKFILEQYRIAGWTVEREVVLSSDFPYYDDYLIFRNPESYETCPKELRASGV